MIGYLKGVVLAKKSKEVTILVAGVGYRVRIGEKTSASIRSGDEVELWIHSHVREDAFDLYGFSAQDEVDAFEILLSVSGVGPKVALAIVGTRSVSQLEKAVREADVSFFQSISGVGKKGAQKIIVDLKGKMTVGKDIDLSSEGDGEVVEALVQFGFSRNEVLSILSKLESSASVADQIRAGLKILGKRT